MIDRELAERIVAYLNELVELDRQAIAALIANRVPCNEGVANHPSCQVGKQHGEYHVGLLGILNGLCGVYEDGPHKGWGGIAAEFQFEKAGELGNLVGFRLLNVQNRTID